MKFSHDGDTAKWDPVFTRQVKNAVGPVVKRYFRAEVNGLESLPASGGALVGQRTAAAGRPLTC